MRLAKAIEILEYHEPSLDENPDIRFALKLGIEALKYIDTCHHNPNCFHISLLEGEAKE